MKDLKPLIILLGILLVATAGYFYITGQGSSLLPTSYTTSPSADLQDLDNSDSDLNGMDSDLNSLNNDTSGL